jgi:hypothetical protein
VKLTKIVFKGHVDGVFGQGVGALASLGVSRA